jgi:branched-chain amino acid transport system permease protein
LIGALAALPALRLRNLYLAIATLGLGTVVQKALFEWRGLTGGGGGMTLAPTQLGPLARGNGIGLCYLVMALAAVGLWAARNVANGRTGRAMRLMRESEIASGTLGISVARIKITAFALSAFYAAVAGGLYAYVVGYVSPESFGVGLSISFISMIVIGGLGSPGGPVLGAAFYVLLPELLRGLKDAPGLVFGLALALVMVFLPGGLWGLPARLRGLR